jgi:hypothetical protein
MVWGDSFAFMEDNFLERSHGTELDCQIYRKYTGRDSEGKE